LTGAGLEVTAACRDFPLFKHPKTNLKAIPSQLDQTQFDRHQNAPELKESTRPFTSSTAPGEATRRPAPTPGKANGLSEHIDVPNLSKTKQKMLLRRKANAHYLAGDA